MTHYCDEQLSVLLAYDKYNAHTDPIFKSLGLLKVSDIYQQKALIFYYKFKHNLLPDYMLNFNVISGNEVHLYNTRHRSLLRPDPAHMKLTEGRIEVLLPKIINATPRNILDKIDTHSIEGFKSYVKMLLIDAYNTACQVPNCYICTNR